MDEENKSIEESEGEEPSSKNSNGCCKHRDEPFPPKLKWWQWFFFVVAWVFVLAGLVYVGDQLCFKKWRPSYICCTYIAFGFVLCGLIVDRIVRHKLFIHKERLEDRSEVEATIVEVRTVEPRLQHPEKPDKYTDKKNQLEKEKKRLEKLGPKGWTEYQVLSLNQLLVDFLKEDDLIGRAKSSLEDLQEYTAYSTSRHDPKHYDDWEERINKAIANINKDEEKDESKRDKAAEMLRGELRTLLEHVADYARYWAEGAVVIRGLMTCGVTAIPILLAMGLLPILHFGGDCILYIYNWGLLGIAGSVTAVLWNLHKSDLLYVGSTKGKEALWRAILGAGLGLVAGILLYSMIAGGILSGSAFPDFFPAVSSQCPEGDPAQLTLLNIARSIFWAMFAGFSFEWVFERLRNVKAGEN